jgi:prevent-host-death family protein
MCASSKDPRWERFGTRDLYLLVRRTCTTWKERTAMAISASEARSRLFPLIQQVNDDHVPVRITSKSGDAVLMSAADFDSW